MDSLTRPLARLLSFFYSFSHDYAAAIALLTITVMVVVLPLTLKGTRSMLVMQRLAPELKKLQDKHKNDRQKLNQEMQALYRDNKISPIGGCLPLFLPLPVFFLLYRVFIGLSHKSNGAPTPQHLDHSSQLYRDLVDAGGQMKSFGVDLSHSALSSHPSIGAALPFFGLVIFMVALQYLLQWQASSRAPAPATPQAEKMQVIQKFFPPMIGVISLSIPAGVVLYWVISNLFRVGQQWGMYRFDPLLKTTVAAATAETEKFLEEDNDKGRAQKKGTVRQPVPAARKKKKRKAR